ncbi:MAG: outer membrane protein [Gemmatimonadales bacterium]
MHFFRLALIASALAAPITTAHAQRGSHGREAASAPTGLMLNVHAFTTPGFGIKGPDVAGEIATSLGPGLGARIGWGITPQWMVFVGADLARLGAGNGLEGHWGFGAIEIGGRLSFPSARGQLTPYVTAAYGWRGIGAKVEDQGQNQGDVSFDGMSLSAGGGVQYQMSPALALDGNVSFAYGKFGNYEDPFQTADLDVDNTLTAQVRLGVNFYPSF